MLTCLVQSTPKLCVFVKLGSVTGLVIQADGMLNFYSGGPVIVLLVLLAVVSKCTEMRFDEIFSRVYLHRI